METKLALWASKINKVKSVWNLKVSSDSQQISYET